ncbi:hypothetical protein DY000_02004910 [Brassica cretica]|uniref:Uncharacterized protein n=1 Tax=Brassica cretica TaxID=69181 RepID=A0ABQ7C2Q5_BRACR|nr:hypothetical protein DY000_02004910 [Brassica cretica]
MGIASKGPRIVLRELRRGSTVLGREVGPRPWARARPRFTFGSKAMRRLIGFRFARWRFLPDSFRLKSATGRRLI